MFVAKLVEQGQILSMNQLLLNNLIANYLLKWSCPQIRLMSNVLIDEKTEQNWTNSTLFFYAALPCTCLLLTDRQKRPASVTKLQKIFKWPCEDQRVLQYWSFVSSLLIRRNWPTRGKCTTRAYRLRMGVACLRPAWQQSCFCLVSSSI